MRETILMKSCGFLQFVIVSLSGWGLVIYGGYKLFAGGKGKTEEVIIYTCEAINFISCLPI